MRINNFLARCGVASRRKVEELIVGKMIFVNGNNNIPLSTQIDENIDVVVYNGKTLKLPDEKVYYILNKPKLFLSTVSDDRNRKTILDIVKSDMKIFPIGRLDYNTEGLLLLTNDGDFSNSIIHPSKKIGKTYVATTKYPLKPIEIVKLRKGVLIDEDVKTLPANVSNSEENTKGEFDTQIEIFEGKNRQVRKMFEAVGHKIINLKRIKIGELTLGDLKVGKFRELTKNELNKIFM